MTDQELEARLRAALEHAAPNDLDGVLSRIEPRTQNAQAPIPFEEAARPRRKRRWMPMAAAACLVLAVAGGGGGVRPAGAAGRYDMTGGGIR